MLYIFSETWLVNVFASLHTFIQKENENDFIDQINIVSHFAGFSKILEKVVTCCKI